MLTRTIGRLGAAAAIAIGLLAATALPASATAHDIAITASSTVSINGVTTHFGGHTTTNTCAPNSTAASTIPVDLNSTGGGTVGATNTGYGDFKFGTNSFKVRLLIGGGTVTITTTTVTVTLTGVQAEFRTCNSLTSLCLSNAVSATISGANPSGSLHPGASTNLTLSGSTNANVTAPFTCNSLIRAVINNQLATISLNLHITN